VIISGLFYGYRNLSYEVENKNHLLAVSDTQPILPYFASIKYCSQFDNNINKVIIDVDAKYVHIIISVN